MSNWFKDAKNLIKEAIYVEKDFRLGILNQKWCNIALLVWILSLISGFSVKYLPIAEEGWNPLKGFQFDFGGPVPIFLTLMALFSYPICMTGLVLCYKKGWIERDDF